MGGVGLLVDILIAGGEPFAGRFRDTWGSTLAIGKMKPCSLESCNQLVLRCSLTVSCPDLQTRPACLGLRCASQYKP